VRRSATQLRINAELVDAADGRRRWNRQYDRELSDIFAVQEDIARAIAAEFRLELAGGADDLTLRGQTDDHEAQDLYLEGRFEWNRRTRESLEDAVRLFEQALARDDGYARAHVGLGDANAVLGFYEYRPPGDAFPAAQRAARAALALEPRLAEPHATLGYVALYHDWDWDTAQREFLEAIRVSPDYPVAHQWYANYLTAMGRPSEAEAEMRRASELDPLSMIAHAATGWVLYYAGEQTRARTQLEESKLRDPEFEPAHLWSAWVDEELGELAAAERSARRAVELSGGSTISRATLARVLARQGRVEESRALVAELESERDRGGYVPSYDIARVYVALDDPAAALAWLERARDDRSHSMAFLQVDPQLASLHDEPRFVALAEALGLGHGP
jgi:tetratricopeptide (TPR) repeat protein